MHRLFRRMHPALSNDRYGKVPCQPSCQFKIRPVQLRCIIRVAAHGGAYQVNAVFPGIHSLFIIGYVGHQDLVRVLFPDLADIFRGRKAVPPLPVRAVHCNDIRSCFHKGVHLLHGWGDVSLITFIHLLYESDDRKSCLLLDSRHIPDRVGPYHGTSRLSGGPGHVRHQGALRVIEGFSGQCLAGNDKLSFYPVK